MYLTLEDRGGLESLCASWRQRPPRETGGNRGAPPRGVDVKPPPGDPGIRVFGPILGIFPKIGVSGSF